MATRLKKPEIYAFCQATTSTHGYGHLTLHVHELFGYSEGTLKISCQTGGRTAGEPRTESYAWEHGVSNDYSVLSLPTLRRGYLLMRALKVRLDKATNEHGDPRDFADFAVRVLLAAKVKRVYLNLKVNGVVPGKIQELPSLLVRRNAAQLHAELSRLEQEIIQQTK